MEFKDIPNKIKAAKSKEELAKNWASVLSDLKSARKQAASSRLSELEAQIKKLKDELSAKDSQTSSLQVELNQKIQEATRLNEDMARIRAEFVAKTMAIDKLTQELDTTREQLAKTNENFLIKDRQLAGQVEQMQSLELKLSEALARNEDLLKNIEGKETDIEKTHSRLAHYESGEIERNFLAQINALELKMSTLASDLQGKEKELADFKEFLKARETSLGQELENENKKFLEEKEKLVDTIESQQSQIEELQGELVSFRRLLRREEERSKALQEQTEALERSRRELEDRLAALGIEARDYASKLTRYFELAPTAEKPVVLPLPAPSPLPRDPIFEETTIEEELLRLEGEEGVDLDLEPPPEEPL